MMINHCFTAIVLCFCIAGNNLQAQKSPSGAFCGQREYKGYCFNFLESGKFEYSFKSIFSTTTGKGSFSVENDTLTLNFDNASDVAQKEVFVVAGQKWKYAVKKVSKRRIVLMTGDAVIRLKKERKFVLSVGMG